MTTISLITGGSRGLGRSMALNIAGKGGDVVLTYHHNRTQADAVVAEISQMGRKAVALQLSMGDMDSFAGFTGQLTKALSDTWGQTIFDHLVNNAGHGFGAPIADMAEAEFDTLFDVHVKGVFFLTQALMPMLADGGRIINISSGLTRVTFPGYAAYAAAKGAVEVLTRYLAKELGERQISVNTVAPGAVETDFRGGAVRDTPALNKHIADITALGRAGLPEDIGPMVANLLEADNRWINGQRIEVSGGMLL